MPSIAIDYTPAVQQGAGIGRLTRELIAALARRAASAEYRLFVAGARRDRLPTPPAPHFCWCPTPITVEWWARIWQRAQLPYPVENITGGVDLFHATDFVLPATRRRTRTVLTVHDLTFARAPETASPALKAYLDKVVPRSVARADHVIADSQSTKDDLIALYGTPPDKITVLLSGVDSRFHPLNDPGIRAAVRQKYAIPPRPYVLAVGTVQPRKNYARLIQALGRLRQHGHDVGLVIAGGKGWLEDPIYASIRDQQLQEVVQLIGYADDADLAALYSDAIITAAPSIYEGFGFPVLEAFRCGTPVVTSNVSSLPEVAGNAALLVDPLDVEALTHALERLLTDSALREMLIGRGLERAQIFTWERAAAGLEQIYFRVLA
ncbi:MAG: glycosyltransferase family 1 protein [bacterium]|nr:glycosyltransferase family 1 protein [bacterium]